MLEWLSERRPLTSPVSIRCPVNPEEVNHMVIRVVAPASPRCVASWQRKGLIQIPTMLLSVLLCSILLLTRWFRHLPSSSFVSFSLPSAQQDVELR